MNLFRFALIAAFAAGCTSGTSSKDDDTDTGAIVDTDTDADTDVVDTDETDVVADVTPTFNEGAFTTDWTDFIDCDTNNEVSFEIELNNWGFDTEMYMAATRFTTAGSWDEVHTLEEDTAGRSTANDGNGFSVFGRTLTTGASVGSQTPDGSTIWKCNSAPSLNPSSTADFQVSWALAVWAEGDDSATDAPSDCIVFGQDPEELRTNPSGDGRTPPSWLGTTCRDITL